MEQLTLTECEQLRDAGYPQGATAFVYMLVSWRMQLVYDPEYLERNFCGAPWVACPTMDELILELGKSFWSVSFDPDGDGSRILGHLPHGAFWEALGFLPIEEDPDEIAHIYPSGTGFRAILGLYLELCSKSANIT